MEKEIACDCGWRARCNFNWGYYLESRRLFAETGTGKPFQASPGQGD
jgi:hypothetical protein